MLGTHSESPQQDYVAKIQSSLMKIENHILNTIALNILEMTPVIFKNNNWAQKCMPVVQDSGSQDGRMANARQLNDKVRCYPQKQVYKSNANNCD